MIVFSNKGLIDPRLITTFGVNVKESTHPIGQFGTGLKYAIAILLRLKLGLKIISGGTTYEFTTENVALRGKSFDFIRMTSTKSFMGAKAEQDSTLLGFTTELGKDWELWMAYRELYCNALDENGTVIQLQAWPIPQANTTWVVVDGEAFEDCHNRRWEYFLRPSLNKLFSTDECEIYEGTSHQLFYRGIAVGNFPAPAHYTYNITCDLHLTENRTVRDWYAAQRIIAETVTAWTEEKHVRKILRCPNTVFEGRLDYNWYTITPDRRKAFFSTLKAMAKENVEEVNATAKALLTRYNDDLRAFTPSLLTDEEQQIWDEALRFCSHLGLDFSGTKVVDESEFYTKDGKAFFPRDRLSTADEVAHILVEEWVCQIKFVPGQITNCIFALGRRLEPDPLTVLETPDEDFHHDVV